MSWLYVSNLVYEAGSLETAALSQAEVKVLSPTITTILLPA